MSKTRRDQPGEIATEANATDLNAGAGLAGREIDTRPERCNAMPVAQRPSGDEPDPTDRPGLCVPGTDADQRATAPSDRTHRRRAATTGLHDSHTRNTATTGWGPHRVNARRSFAMLAREVLRRYDHEIRRPSTTFTSPCHHCRVNYRVRSRAGIMRILADYAGAMPSDLDEDVAARLAGAGQACSGWPRLGPTCKHTSARPMMYA
jgi:hypothetical protein